MNLLNGGAHGGEAVRWSALLGVFGAPSVVSGVWWSMVIAWIVIFILWLKALLAYGKAYREYQKTYGKTYQSPCESNQRTRVMLQYLRRLELCIRNLNKAVHLFRKLCRQFFRPIQNRVNGKQPSPLHLSSDAKPHSSIWLAASKLLNKLRITRFDEFARESHKDGRLTPNDPSSPTAADSDGERKGDVK